jgi:hypothetical protein
MFYMHLNCQKGISQSKLLQKLWMEEDDVSRTCITGGNVRSVHIIVVVKPEG